MGSSHLLAAIVPPGSVEAEVGRLQEGIFSTHGILSAQALPPIVPLSFLPMGTAPVGFLGSLERTVRAPWRMRSSGFSWAEGFLFLSMDSAGLWTALRAAALSMLCAGGPEPRGLFPLREGFFLGCGEATADQRERVRLATPDLAFTSADLALLRIEAPRGTEDWWRELHWETIDQRPLRGRRKE
jgi:hypothetical protein